MQAALGGVRCMFSRRDSSVSPDSNIPYVRLPQCIHCTPIICHLHFLLWSFCFTWDSAALGIYFQDLVTSGEVSATYSLLPGLVTERCLDVSVWDGLVLPRIYSSKLLLSLNIKLNMEIPIMVF